MNSAPLVSIVVTCHNQEDVIAQALNSVLNQNYTNWECLVVDDGSLDKSAEKVNEIALGDDRFRYLYQKNEGVAAARNLGFANSHGEFIQFLDGDDLLDAEKLESHVTHFMSDPTIDVSCALHQFYLSSSDRFETFEFERIEPYPLKQLLFRWHKGLSLPVHAPIYRKSIWEINELPYPNDYHDRCEDWVFLVLVAAKNKKFATLDKVLCTYVIHGENFTRDIKNSCTAAILAARYLENKIPSEFQKDLVSNVIDRSLTRFLEAKKPEILHASKNWQLGNLLTRPFFSIYKKMISRKNN